MEKQQLDQEGVALPDNHPEMGAQEGLDMSDKDPEMGALLSNLHGSINSRQINIGSAGVSASKMPPETGPRHTVTGVRDCLLLRMQRVDYHKHVMRNAMLSP